MVSSLWAIRKYQLSNGIHWVWRGLTLSMRFTLSTVHRFALRVAEISLSARSSHCERILYYFLCYYITGLPRWLSGKGSACQCRRYEFSPWVRKIPWRREWQPTPVFLEYPMNREAWWATVHGAARSQRQLSNWAHYIMNYTTLYCHIITAILIAF